MKLRWLTLCFSQFCISPFPHLYSFILYSPFPFTRYKWLFFINPNYFGFSAVMRVMLENFNLPCTSESSLECYPTSGRSILTLFSLHNIDPYLHAFVCSLPINGWAYKLNVLHHRCHYVLHTEMNIIDNSWWAVLM